MHAVVGVVAMDEDRLAEQQRFLHDVVVPGMRDRPGFVAGFWMYDEAAALGRATIVFENEAYARQFWRVLDGEDRRRREQLGLAFTDLHVVEVLAHARAA